MRIVYIIIIVGRIPAVVGEAGNSFAKVGANNSQGVLDFLALLVEFKWTEVVF